MCCTDDLCRKAAVVLVSVVPVSVVPVFVVPVFVVLVSVVPGPAVVSSPALVFVVGPGSVHWMGWNGVCTKKEGVVLVDETWFTRFQEKT